MAAFPIEIIWIIRRSTVMGAYGTVGTAPFQSIRQSHDLNIQKKKLAKETPQAKKKIVSRVVFSFSIFF